VPSPSTDITCGELDEKRSKLLGGSHTPLCAAALPIKEEFADGGDDDADEAESLLTVPSLKYTSTAKSS